MNGEELDVVEHPAVGGVKALRRPGRLAADIEGGLAVSDTGHHRVLVGSMVGDSFDVERVIGRGEPGFADGPFEVAAFRDPEGLALSGDMLIVADRGNHAIRMIDLESREVHTMAGTGEPAPGPIAPGGDPIETALLSPWDVLLWNYNLFIAMAGSHQVWRLDLKDSVLESHAEAGDGGGPSGAGLVAPMALATDGQALYFAHAASSSVRRVAFEPGGEVEILVGTGAADSEDEDHERAARLSRAAGLAWGMGNHRLWIADTGHHKLKMLDPVAGSVEAVEPFEERLDQPMGLASAGHLLYVADTGRDRILRVDQIDKRVVELTVEL
ncbi:MAG: hypothetical protein ACREK5_09015 [Gemmatimonadota bacterium]